MPLTHLSALTTCQQIGWIDVLETNPEHVRRIKRNQKIRHCFASLAELKAHADDYTIACIATPGDTHFSMLEALNKSAINIGHVLCEKPLFSAAEEVSCPSIRNQTDEVPRNCKLSEDLEY